MTRVFWLSTTSRTGRGVYRRSACGYCAVEQGQAVYSRQRTISIAASTLAYKRAEIVELSDTVQSEKYHA